MRKESKIKIKWLDPGEMAYGQALHLQQKIHQKVMEGEWDAGLVLLTHPHVITLGRRGEQANIIASGETLAKKNVEIHRIGRGGDVTYHGPGQLVGYPMMDVRRVGGIKEYVYRMEEALIHTLKEHYGIIGTRGEKKYTGIWVGDGKITAIGIEVKHFVSMHGFALNVNTDLSCFDMINPCGITDKGVVSMEKLLGSQVEMHRVKMQVLDSLCRVFDCDAELTKEPLR